MKTVDALLVLVWCITGFFIASFMHMLDTLFFVIVRNNGKNYEIAFFFFFFLSFLALFFDGLPKVFSSFVIIRYQRIMWP